MTVSSHPAEFVHNDPLSNLNISNAQDCHTHPELKRKLYSALAEGDEGELSIAIPKEVSLRQSGHAATGIVSEGALSTSINIVANTHGLAPHVAATPEPQTPGHNFQPSFPVPEFVPIIVNITYSLRNPVDGVQFVVPTDAYPYVGRSNSTVTFI